MTVGHGAFGQPVGQPGGQPGGGPADHAGGTLLIHDVRIVDAETDIARGWLLADASGILRLGEGPAPEVPVGCQRVCGGGRLLTPGLIDMHSHGGGGGSFSGGPAEIATALAATAAHGVTRSMLSLVTSSAETIVSELQEIAALAEADSAAGAGTGGPGAGEGTAAGKVSGAGILGVHLEGPFISPEKAGAHDSELMQHPTPELIDRFADAGAGWLRCFTIAPELPGALDSISHAVERGIRMAVGHTTADYATTREAFDAGATILTHAFNAMPGIHHRAPGPIIAALEDERVCVELILDGMHVLGPVAAQLWRSCPGRLALITDAMSAAGFRDGEYVLGALPVTVKDGLATLTGTQTIAGSTLTLDAAVRRALTLGIGLQEAVAAATSVPAAGLGISARHGSCAPGQAADFVLWDDDMHVSGVWRDACEIRRETECAS